MECIIMLLRWVSVLGGGGGGGGGIYNHSHQSTHTHTFSRPIVSVLDLSVKGCLRLSVFKIIILSSTMSWQFFFYRWVCVWVCAHINALFLAQDKQGIPWWLGLSYKGIFQYDYQDKIKPRKVRLSFLCGLTTVWLLFVLPSHLFILVIP